MKSAREVLEELASRASQLGATYEDSAMTDESYQKTYRDIVTHALSQLQELLPKDRGFLNIEDTQYSFYNESYWQGYNQALADCREVLARQGNSPKKNILPSQKQNALPKAKIKYFSRSCDMCMNKKSKLCDTCWHWSDYYDKKQMETEEADEGSQDRI